MILMLNKQEILPPNDFIEADVVQRVCILNQGCVNVLGMGFYLTLKMKRYFCYDYYDSIMTT